MTNPITQVGNRIVHGKKTKYTVDYTNYKSRTGQLICTKEFDSERELIKWVQSNSTKPHIEINSFNKDAKKAIKQDLKPPTFVDVTSAMVKDVIENAKKIVNKFKKEQEQEIAVLKTEDGFMFSAKVSDVKVDEKRPSLRLIK